jgi:hypothetical protein
MRRIAIRFLMRVFIYNGGIFCEELQLSTTSLARLIGPALKIATNSRLSRTGKEKGKEAAEEGEVQVIATGKSLWDSHSDHRYDHHSSKQKSGYPRAGSENKGQATEKLNGGCHGSHDSRQGNTGLLQKFGKAFEANEKLLKTIDEKNDAYKQSQNEKGIVSTRTK